MVYESMLLFGVLFVSNLIFSTLVEQRHALYLRHALQAWLFLVVAAYFVWFWTHGGQTLAMKTWRMRLVDVTGRPVGYARASLRYILAWFWILPGMLLAWMGGAQGPWLIVFPAVNLLLWAMTAYLNPQHQFLHDRLAGTRLQNLAQAEAATANPARPTKLKTTIGKARR